MAIVKNNFLMRGLAGSLGKALVLKRMKGKTIVCSYPDRSSVILSRQQKAANEKFKQAVAFAKSILADPERKAAFAAGLKRGENVYQAAIKQFMKNSQ